MKLSFTLFLICVALLSSCTASTVEENEETEDVSGTAVENAAILPGNAEDVLATVNGEKVTMASLQFGLDQALQTASLQGMDVTDESVVAELRDQVLRQFIDGTVVRQAAADSDISVSDEEVEAEFQTILQNVGGEEALVTELEKANITEEKLREDIHTQMQTQRFVDQHVAESAVEVTDEEVRASYDEAKAQQPALPSFEEFAGQIRTQLVQEKQQQVVIDLVTTLREEASITSTPTK